MSWALQAINVPYGTSAGVIVPASFTVTRRLSSWNSLEFRLTSESIGARLAEVGTALKLWWLDDDDPSAPGVERWAGRITSTEAESDGGIPTVVCSAHDPLEQLQRRLIVEDYYWQTSKPWYLIDGLIQYFDADADTYLRIDSGTEEDGAVQEFVAQFGDSGGEAIIRIATSDNGAYFTIEPNTGGSYHLAKMVMKGLVSGLDVEVPARFEHGDGTVGNVHTFRTVTTQPHNAVVNTTDVADTYTAVLEPYSRQRYGANDLMLNTGEESEASLASALARLKPDPIKTFTMEVVPYGSGSYVPRPWLDFNVGGIVQVTCRSELPQLDFSGRCRVTEYQLAVDENGLETLASVTVEEEGE